MSERPIDVEVSADPINLGSAIQGKPRVDEEAMAVSVISGGSLDENSERIEAGDRGIVRKARQELDSKTSNDLLTAADQGLAQGLTPEESLENYRTASEKKKQFYTAQDSLFLEHALSLGDDAVSADSLRIATNMQVGQELFQEALSETSDGAGFSRYAVDFIDRYFVRAFPIGGYEQITNRNERKGQELMAAAMTMEPEQYKAFIGTYINELKEEGVFKGDNIFAIADGFAEFENKGFDKNEVFNRLMGGLDLAPVLAVGKVAKATTPLRRVAAISGPEKAAEVGELFSTTRLPKPDVINDLKPSALDPGKPSDVVVPSNRAVSSDIENSIIRELSESVNKGVLGQGTETIEATRATDEILSAIRKGFNNPVVNVGRSLDVLGNNKLNVLLGRVKSGKPFKKESGAQTAAAKIADEFPTAKAVPVDETDLTKGYYVQVDEVLDTTKFVDEIDTQTDLNAVQRIYARFTGSKAAMEDPKYNTKALQAEAVVSGIGGSRAVKAVVKVLDSLPTKEQRVVTAVFKELRDGKDAFLRETYTSAEFKLKYAKQHPDGNLPTQREVDAFNALRTLGDASYMMRAHNRMQKYIQNGFYGLDLPDGAKVAGRIVDDLAGSDEVVDVMSGTRKTKASLHHKTKVWELDRPLEGGVIHIVNPENVRGLSHSDVLGYNGGGRRINPIGNYFLLSGDEYPRAFLTAFTEEQAIIAQDQINTLLRADELTDDLVQANNKWNPELETVEDFQQFIKDKGIDPEKGVFFKSRDGEIRTGEVKDIFSESWDEYVNHSLSRSDQTLTDFGGGEAMNFDPVNAMFKDFGSISQQFAFNHYTETAMNAWLKAARRQGSGWDVPATTNNRAAFEGAVKSENTNAKATALGTQRSIIKNRMGIKSEPFQAMEAYGADLQEYVFNKSGLKINRDPAKGITQKLLNVGFQSAFGFGNIGQFFVQGYHSATIMAISPRAGIKSFAEVPALRMILLGAKDEATEAAMVQNYAKFTGQSVDEVAEAIDYIRTSGRDILDGSMIEDGTGTQWGLSGWKGESFLPNSVADAGRTAAKTTKQGLDIGLTPFKEGERMARLTGINTAIREYRLANPGKGLDTAEAKAWITRREQALSFRMTNANRALMQEGFGKLPTQWFTYTLRSMENVLIGRDFTTGERARLALALFPAFGLTGMGAGKAADWLSEKLGAEPAGNMHTLVKYGIFDSLFEYASDGEIELALAERLAPITLLSDVYKNVTEDSAVAAVFGPSGDIGSNLTGAVVETFGNLAHGNSVSMTEDAVRTIRQFSGIDNVFKAYGIYQNGVYRSRNGKTLPFELDASDAVGQLLGFTPREINEWYQEKQWSYEDSRKVKDLTTMLQSDMSRAKEVWDTGDTERSLKLMEAIELRIIASGLSPYDQATVRRNVANEKSGEVARMILEQYKRENYYRANVLEETFK